MTISASDLDELDGLTEIIDPADADMLPILRTGEDLGFVTIERLSAIFGSGGGGGGGGSDTAWDTPEANGAVGGGVTDDTTAVNAWLASANPLKAATGVYAVKGSDELAAMTCATSGNTIIGGTFVPIANGSGHAPGITFLVSGTRNTLIGVEVRNSGNLGKATSDGSHEYPMDGIRLQGSDNTATDCRAWNFVTPFRVQGSGTNAENCHFRGCRGTVKDVSNSAYSNDGILFTFADYGSATFCQVGMSTGASTRTVAFEAVSGASTSTLRCGITADASTTAINFSDNWVGEGFIVGIDHEGTGTRRNIISRNYVFKQQRNAISPAGNKFLIEGNWLYGTFNTESTSTTGIIGGSSDDTVIRGNMIYCDTTSIPGIQCAASTNNTVVSDNQFIGSFSACVKGIGDRWIIHDNILNGTAVRGVDMDRTGADTKTSHLKVHDNIFNGVSTQAVRATSGFLSVNIADNKIVLLEGYAAADGVIEIGGGGSGVVGVVAFHVTGNECVYAGTTSVTGTKDFVLSSISGGTGTVGYVRDNTFPSTIFTKAIGGNFITALVQVSGNSLNATDAGARSGTFTCGAVNDFSTAALVSSTSILTLTPTNQAAATLQSGAKALSHYANVVGTGFFLKTADGNNCAGTETFEWFLTEP